MMYIGIFWKERCLVFMRNKDIVHIAPVTGTKQKQVSKSIDRSVKEIIREGEPYLILYVVDKELCRHLQAIPDRKEYMAGIELQKVPKRRFMNGLWRLSTELIKDSFAARLKAETVHLNEFHDKVMNECPMSAAIAAWPHRELLGGRK